MQAVTARPWYWRRRPRPRTSARALRRLRLDWRLLDAGQIRHLIRVESSLVTAAPAPGRERGWRLEDFTSLRQPITEQQAQHKRAPGFTPREGDMLIVDGIRWPIDGPWATGGKATGGATTGGVATGAVTTGGSTSGAASVALATVLLLILALLLRAADKCRARQLVKTAARRRQSEEWPIPNVAATSLSVRMSGDAEGGGDLDCPPPYAAVADTPPLPTNKQPPPPYSACCGDDSPLYHETLGVNDSRAYNDRPDNALYHDRAGVNDSRMNVRHGTGSVDIECEVIIDTDRNVRRVAFYNTSLRANERAETTVDNDCEATGETDRRVSFNNTISVADDNPNACNVAYYSNTEGLRDPHYNNVYNTTTAIDSNYTGSRNIADSGGVEFSDRSNVDFGDSKTIVVNMDFDLAPKERHLLV